MSSGNDMMTEGGGEITQRRSGVTLTNSDGTIILGADGSISGDLTNGGAIAGAWTERNGQYCRTLTAPERLAGTLCQDVRFNDDGTVSFLRGAAGDVTFDMS